MGVVVNVVVVTLAERKNLTHKNETVKWKFLSSLCVRVSNLDVLIVSHTLFLCHTLLKMRYSIETREPLAFRQEGDMITQKYFHFNSEYNSTTNRRELLILNTMQRKLSLILLCVSLINYHFDLSCEILLANLSKLNFPSQSVYLDTT